MGNADTEYAILIKGTDQSKAAVGAADQALRQYAQQLKTAKQLAAEGKITEQQLGEAVLKHRAAQQALTDAIRAATAQANQGSAAHAAFRDVLTSASQEVGKYVPGMQALTGVLGSVGTAAASAGGIVAGLAVGFIALEAASVMAAKSIGDYQQHIENIKQTTGLTTAEFGGLSIAAVNVNKSFEQVEPALDMFVRKLGEAREGNKEMIEVFRGIDITKSTGEVLQEIVTKLDGIPEPAKRAAEAGKFFSRQWHEILPVITQDMQASSEEAQKWGITLSGSAEKAALRTNLAFDKLGARWKGFVNTLESSQASNGESFANWAIGVIDWSQKVLDWNEKVEKQGLRMMGIFDKGAPGMSARQAQDDGTPPIAPAPPILHGLNEDQEKDLRAIQDQIAALERLRAAKKLLIDDEIVQLNDMEKTAIALKDQVLAAAELLAIRRASTALSDKEEAFPPAFTPSGAGWVSSRDPQLSKPPFSKSELLPFSGMAQGASGNGLPSVPNPMDKAFTNFGTDASGNMAAQTAEFKKRLQEMAEALNVAGSASGEFTHLIKIHQAELDDAYAKGDEALKKRLVALKNEAVFLSAANAALHAMAAGIGDFFESILQHGGGSFWDKLGGFMFGLDKTFLNTFVAGKIPTFQSGGHIVGTARAQSGLVTSGVRGLDSILGLFGKDEAVIDHSMTARWDRTLGQIARVLTPATSPQPSPAFATRSGPSSVTIPITVTGTLIDRFALKALVTDHLGPLLRELSASGVIRI